MIEISDLWTPAHALIGLFFARIRYPRLLYYPIPFGWEIYQVFFHYQPLGITFDQFWINTVADILAGIIGYELIWRYWNQKLVNPLWLRFSDGFKALAAYILIVSGITWLLWNEVLLGAHAPQIPIPAFTLILGALSPLATAYIMRHSIYKAEFTLKGWSRLFPLKWNYYLVNGVFPSVITGIVILIIEAAKH
jgi:hypothetical protein